MNIRSCVVCGEFIHDEKNASSVCESCKEYRKKDIPNIKSIQNEITRLTRIKRLRQAKAIIADQVDNYNEYELYFKKIEEDMFESGWFDTINEVLVNVELLKQGIKVQHQVRIKKWRVDFVIPELKCILEIDGPQHKMRKDKDRIRDMYIIAALGPRWEILRIDNDLIRNKIPKILHAIKCVLHKRRQIRAQNKGQLPHNYCDQI